LIEEQIKVAAGTSVADYQVNLSGHSIECRINAEDPEFNFRPSAGEITVFHPPGGQGVRLDTHVYSGYRIPPHYDSMIAKLIVTAQTRPEAIIKMRRALQEFIIEGVKTTIPYHIQLMDDPNFNKGSVSTKYLETSFTFKAEKKRLITKE
jgi:acetyl-CoA carboxylase biotin carboxylase subunit